MTGWVSVRRTSGRELDLGTDLELRAVRCRFADEGPRRFRIEAAADPDGDWWPLLDHPEPVAGRDHARAVSGRFRRVRVITDDEPTALIVTTAPSGRDLTWAATVSASSDLLGHEAFRALETTVDTGWRPAADDPDPWLVLELDQPARIAAVEVMLGRPGPAPIIEWSGAEDASAMTPESWEAMLPVDGPDLDLAHSATPAGSTGPPRHRDLPPRRFRIRPIGPAGPVDDQGPVAVVAVRIFGEAPEADELGFGCPVRVSTSELDRPGSAATDGRPDTSWRPRHDDAAPWLVVDLGQSCRIDRVDVHPAAPVELSTDGRMWAPVGTGTARLIRVRPSPGSQVERVRAYGRGAPIRQPWWRIGGPAFRYFPKEYDLPLSRIAADLPRLRAEGFAAIELAGIKQGPPSAFAGLGATDPFMIDTRLGTPGPDDVIDTAAEFTALVESAHRSGLRVIVFDNLGYAHVAADRFREVADRFARDPSADPYPFLLARESGGDRWFLDHESGCYYYAYWGVDLPSYDWSDQRWQAESRMIIEFWRRFGIDGLGIDAPAAYPGITAETEREYVAAPLADAGFWGLPEGTAVRAAGEPQDAWQRAVRDQGFTAILDLSISVWHDASHNRLVPAIATGDLSGIEPLLAQGRDLVAAAGGAIIEAPAWEADLTGGTPDPDRTVPAEHRLLEMAILSTAGSFFYQSNGLHTYRPEVAVLPGWSGEHRDRLRTLLGTVAAAGPLSPSGARIPIPSGDPAVLAWLRSDPSGLLRAIVVHTAAPQPETILLELTGLGLPDDADVSDLLGRCPAKLTGSRLAVELPALGSAILVVD